MTQYPIWRRRLKHALGWVVYASGLYRLWFRNRAIIVLFHRIDDDLVDDAMSCSAKAFDGFCRFFKRFFHVITLQELVDRLNSSKSISQCLVVTFDDGYKDNWEAAAPTLSEHGLSACFFVTTDFIGTHKSGWWDEERGIESRWMSWSDVRDLETMGQEVGAHTKTHADLGTIHGAEAEEEIAGSRRRIASELNDSVHSFSVPFGGREHITERNRSIVRRSGFSCCCSAFGGDVRPNSDPFDLPRVAVSPWFVSPYQLGFELLLEGQPE